MYASPSQVPADVEKCQDRMECFNADLKADMERWQNNKRQDFRQLLMGMADKNIQYYEKVMSWWWDDSPPLNSQSLWSGPARSPEGSCQTHLLPLISVFSLSEPVCPRPTLLHVVLGLEPGPPSTGVPLADETGFTLQAL